MTADDDILPTSYQYEWDSSSELSLKDFLAKYKPSMVQNDGTKPWIWVQKSKSEEENGREAAIDEAAKYVKEVAEKVEAIKNDDSIPLRGNKKKGTKSKKELREELQSEAAEKLKEISERHGYVSGKWLIFAPADRIDIIWSTVANSIIEGPLNPTSVHLAKVATSPKNDTPNYQHVMCLYMPNVYDKETVLEVMKVLLRKHGLNLNGVKSNLYTSIGLDSKHPSGIQSTVWRNTALLKETEIKELKDAYYAELSAAKAEVKEQSAQAKAEGSGGDSTTKVKPKLKRKAAEDDPFASDDEEEPKESEKKALKPKATKTAPPKKKKKVEEDEFLSDEDEEKEVKKQNLKKKPATSRSKKPVAHSDDDEEDEDTEVRPKKKLPIKKTGKK
ncbi:hypothetical protein C8Q75DRAFT_860478 [Abortiporus biennis]|nr:hypothetical protein C8Q75DRAFT_860478 [Abortiporus biennis]